ncbi:putative glycerol-3-phosphate 1-O-acyltransferase [Helianthus anomalus]
MRKINLQTKVAKLAKPQGRKWHFSLYLKHPFTCFTLLEVGLYVVLILLNLLYTLCVLNGVIALSYQSCLFIIRGGSKLIWIAASGGRDRPDPITNQWSPAPFDASAVDNMRSASELLQIRKWFDYSGLLRF